MSGSLGNFRPKRGAILEVPFEEKDEAKALGAWWDPELKKWFVPYGKDVKPFKRWVVTEEIAIEKTVQKAANG